MASDPQDRALCALAFCLATACAFFLLGVMQAPVPLYFPIGRRWGLSGEMGEISMDWYGRTLYAWIAGAAGAALCFTVLRLTRRRGRALTLVAAYAATAIALCALLYAYKLLGRDVSAGALPAPPSAPTLEAAPAEAPRP